ncbi:MAG: hypothetical protein PHI85_07500 [Victivallaceae bacterium]|nr:hypothetical protein [Victivallaceae bacterium]
MESTKNDALFKFAAFTLIAVSAFLLPGAVSLHSEEAGRTGDQATAAMMVESMDALTGEIPAADRASYAALEESDPLFLMQMSSQRFEQSRHRNLWK